MVYFFVLLLVIAIVAGIIQHGAKREALDELICARCGSRGAKEGLNGNAGIEVVFWLLFIVPGIIYTFTRTHHRPKICRACSAAEMVPIESPRGQKLCQEFHRESRLSLP